MRHPPETLTENMPALTVWSPWSILIAAGAKPYEFRSWKAPKALWGRRIAIHTGARPVKKAEISDLIIRLQRGDWTTCLRPEIALPILEKLHAAPKMAVLSHVVCTAILREPILGHDIASEFGGVLNDSDRAEHCNWAWPLDDIRSCEPPVPAKGAQGFWPWKQEALV